MAYKKYYPPVEHIYRTEHLYFIPQPTPNFAEALAAGIKTYNICEEYIEIGLKVVNRKNKRGSNQSKKSVIMYERDVKLVMHKDSWGYRKRPKYGKKARRVFKQGTT